MNYNELKTKSLSDDNFAKQMSFKLSDSSERASFFTWISSLGIHWQENPTPYEIIRKMVSKTSLNDKHILVLFNIEFLHILIDEQGVNPQYITFIADNHLEKLSANKIFKVQSYCVNHKYDKKGNPIYDVKDLYDIIKGLNMKFDLVFSNPPYNSNLDVKILNEIISVSNEFIVIHPSISVIDIKGKTSDFVKFKKNANFKSIELFMGNKLFDIQLENPCMISHIDNNYQGDITVIDSDKKQTYIVDDSNLITKYGKEWIDFVQAFYKQIKEYCENDGSLWSMRMMDCTKFHDNSKFFVQLTAMMMGYSKGVDKPADKFYSLTMKNYSTGGDKSWNNGNVGVRDFSPKTEKTVEPKKPSYEFETEEQRLNFLNYCQTDFARFCLSLIKNNAHLDSGELGLVPWLDFTEEWDDEKLFKKFNVSQELQDYIREFLPDFHGIRK